MLRLPQTAPVQCFQTSLLNVGPNALPGFVYNFIGIISGFIIYESKRMLDERAVSASATYFMFHFSIGETLTCIPS